MSEGEVTQIRDEDVLRRMWQQTEDFSRKKEIRAHMYRLREERLRNLYSPEPMAEGKGCEFTSAQGHVQSFADQTFQSMKSKEVRDAGSPPKEFTYRGQDLKELSNAGWNVESENRTTNDGRTHVKSVNANIEGLYDVDGGRGQFAAVDRQRRAVTEHHDAGASLRRDETSSDTAAHEHVVRHTDDGTRVTSTTSSSNTSSKIEQVSSTKHETVPCVTDDDYDRRYSSQDTNRNERVTRITNKNDYEQTVRNTDYNNSELVSRKVEYPDSDTKVIVETRRLPDGTRVTSTRREFRAPAQQSTRSESYQTRSESKSYSSQHQSDSRNSSSKVSRHTVEDRSNDIVDSQRSADDSDFKRQILQYTTQDNDDYVNTQQRHITKSDRKVSDYSQTDDDYSQIRYETKISKGVDLATTNRDDQTQTQRRVIDRRTTDDQVDEVDRRQVTTTRDHDIRHNVVKEIHQSNDSEDRVHNITVNRKDTEIKVRDNTLREKIYVDETFKTPKDDNVPYDRTRDEPKDHYTPSGYDMPRETPKDAKSPYSREAPHDEIPIKKRVTEERVHNTTRDTKVEEVVEKKTSSEQYQTTYQNDYQNRKISTDWSPTHQAWASTLRSDTPSTTRPSTRASSPGSKTFKSSTSSLRSSVSPDKISRKPTSRGGSPNKVDRYSPTRTTTSDRYSTTHSSQSTNEVRTSKTTSLERKPPIGGSPSRPGYSPDRKPQDNYRQRPSVSPEKRTQNFGDKRNTSPERKPINKYPGETAPVGRDRSPNVSPRQSPERKSNIRPSDDNHGFSSPFRTTTSPQRKPSNDYPKHSSPRQSPSPDRKSTQQTPLNKDTDVYPNRSSPRSSSSPDRKQGHQQPTATTGLPRTSSPSRPQYHSDVRQSVSPDRKPGYMRPTAASQPDTNRSSPIKNICDQSQDQKPTNVTKNTKINEEHYRFIDEETKIHTHKENTKSDNKTTSVKNVYQKDNSPDHNTFPVETDKSSSVKDTSYVSENNATIDTVVTQEKHSQDNSSVILSNDTITTTKRSPSRETSPTKYGTYDKKKPHKVIPTDVTEVSTKDSKDAPGVSPSKKSPRVSTSPLKSPNKDTKSKQTSDFLTSEIKTEEIYKKTSIKERPRQLITPSSSPTRKPKVTETEPSTGQSSPTTSVSGFVYFGSPRTEKPMITDLDEIYPDSENLYQEPTEKSEGLDVKRSPSPSKIPCRSPSPEKYIPSAKDRFPRKSSLKKPSIDVNLTSPVEKPPTNFRVSPSDDIPSLLDHKKDQPEEPKPEEPDNNDQNSTKPKPPLQRRETYEDRCKKILGMVDTKISESKTRETTHYMKNTSCNQNSPSISPCDSPAHTNPQERLHTAKDTNSKIDVTDFISREQEHIIKTTIPRDETKTSRDTSPAKLLDITKNETLITQTINKEIDQDFVINDKSTKYTRKTPDKPSETFTNYPKENLTKHPNASPERKFSDTNTPKSTRPVENLPSRSSISPERKPIDKFPKETSPRKQSPEKSSRNSTTITSVTSQYDVMVATDDIEDNTHVTKRTKTLQPTRVLESPTRQISSADKPRTASPSRSNTKDGSPERKLRPESVVDHSPNMAHHVTENTPGYMKSTTATTTKFETAIATKDMEETYTSKTRVHKESFDKSTRQTAVTSRSPSPKKSTPQSLPKRLDSSPQRNIEHPMKRTKPETDRSRTPSPTKQTRPTHMSPERKPSSKQQPKHQSDGSPNRLENITKEHKSKTVTSEHTKVEHGIEDIQEITSTTRDIAITRNSESPIKNAPTSKSNNVTHRQPEKQNKSPDRMMRNKTPANSMSQKPVNIQPQAPRATSPAKSPGYMKTTESVTSKFETTEFIGPELSERPQTRSPTDKSPKTSVSPDRQRTIKSSVKGEPQLDSDQIKHKPERSSVSPDKPNYMKPTASVISKFETTFTSDTQENITTEHNIISEKRGSESPLHEFPENVSSDKYILSKPVESRQLRTPSPTKKTTNTTEVNKEFLISEREQEILNKVQKSLRKLSPERKEKSPSRERSPTKSTTSLQDLDILTTENENVTEDLSQIVEENNFNIKSNIIVPAKSKPTNDNKVPSKPSLKTISPTKKMPSSSPTKSDKSPESPSKSRSISPRKHLTHGDRPQSPQVAKSSGIKPREQIPPHLTRKPTPVTLSTTKIEKATAEIRKTNGATKQNVLNKTTTTKTVTRNIPSPTGKSSESESKRVPSQKSVKENISPKKDVMARTTSDIGMKPKKTSPQRIKSKPEIQVSDMSTKSTKLQKPQTKLPNKPKSATALNTSTDDDDIIIDVQQSKSSRENSPDRICPTPINFADDVGTPRFPDEVNEPDDDFIKRTHQTIHETETLVDDIVEICEDEELFVKKTNKDEKDDSLLSVNDKVHKFTNKIRSVSKPKDTTDFKDMERKVHSDFIDDNLKSDECLLTVSEKVNKFAKGPKETNDNRSPSRKITEEYDIDTVYQDDYTKLSVNDKAHLFVETAENIKTTKVKPTQKVERPDLSNVDESLKSDDCLLSVSDKVNKFVKTAETFLTDSQVVEQTDKKITEKHEESIKEIVVDQVDDKLDIYETINSQEIDKIRVRSDDKIKSYSKEPEPLQSKINNSSSAISKPSEKPPTVKITTLRSSEAVKKAKALFENIASTQKTKETIHTTKSPTKLTDIGVIKKSPKEQVTPLETDIDTETDLPLHTKGRPISTSKPQNSATVEKPRLSHLTTESPEAPRSKSPMRQSVEVSTTKTVLSRYPAATRAESPRHRPESPMQQAESPRQRTESPRQRHESDKPDKLPGYLRPTKTSQNKEEPKIVDEPEVSTRRGSGKFGVELRRTSVERSTVSSERRRSVEHHQPCIEDIFDIDLLEQMLEKVTGYEQRRRIRAQIRVARHQSEHIYINTKSKRTITSTTKTKSPERQSAKSPERTPKITPQKTSSPDRHSKSTPLKAHPYHSLPNESTPVVNGHAKDSMKTPTRQRPQSPEKPAPKTTLTAKTPSRQPSPDKRRPTSPTKTAPKSKSNRFNEYASAYMKKVGLNESDKVKFSETKKSTESRQTVKHEKDETIQEFTTTKTFNERTSSKDIIEIVQLNGKRSPSPEKRRHSPERKAHVPDKKAASPERKAHSPARKVHSLERHAQSPDRLYQRTPSPDFKRPKADTVKETIIKTVYDVEKKIPSKQVQEEKPSWVTNRNLKKITSESRTYSSKKIESEKPKYRAASPSKVISKPMDVITSSYGPGPLDADGKPLFGIKALRNGGNFQVKGTVIRQEFHSRNGGEPEGTVSVTAYSSQPEELEQLLAAQGAEPPSRLHGLAAITTTKKFGGDTGNSYSKVHTKEERASLEQFTHSDRKIDSRLENLETTFDRLDGTSETRRIDSQREDKIEKSDRTVKREEKEVRRGKVEERRERVEKREDKKTVRQSSVKSLTEKYIKSANDSSKSDRASYPKAGLILRTTTMRDSVSSDDAHPGLTRADSEHSLGSGEDTVVTTTQRSADGVRTTTTRTTHHGPTVTHTKTSTLTHEPVITKKTSTVIMQEPIISKKTSYVTQEGVTHRVVGQEPTITHKVVHEPVKVSHTRGTTTTTTEKSFLDNNTKVTGVQDILTRMKNADIVIQDGDSTEDSEARALLNKFLGATVLMAGMQGYVADAPGGKLTVSQETVRTGGAKVTTSRSLEEFDLDNCWDERILKKLLDECTDYEQRRRLRARIRTLMAEQEACASAVTEALGAAAEDAAAGEESREEEEVTVTSSVRRDSSDKTVSSSTTTTKTSKVIEMTRSAPKPVSPFAKFRQLEKQNSTNSPNSPKTPQSPGSPSQPYFKFTDPALQCSALTIKERLLQWCRDKTRDYENVKLENFSTSWADGLAFCALVHHFLPDAFDYSKLTPDRRRHNFTLAFKVADEKAGIYPLLDVDDMVAMRKPDWKCVFTYVQAIYRRFKDQD